MEETSNSTPGDTSAAGSPTAAPSNGAATQPSDTGAAHQTTSATQRGPVPYERIEQLTRQMRAEKAAWAKERQELLARSSGDDVQRRLSQAMLDKLTPKKTYDDPLEERLDGLHGQYEKRFQEFDSQRKAMEERLNAYETERVASRLQSEYDAALSDPRFAQVAAVAKSKHGQQTLNMFLSQNHEASMADGFEFLLGLAQGLTPAQAAAQATDSSTAPAAPAKKPPVLNTPGTGGSVTKLSPAPRTFDEARAAARKMLG